LHAENAAFREIGPHTVFAAGWGWEDAMARSGRRLSRLYVGGLFLLVVTVIGCVVYMQWEQLRLRYHARRFVDQGESSSEAVLRSHTSGALPVVTTCLTQAAPEAAGRIERFWKQVLSENSNPAEPVHSQLSLSLAAKLQLGWTRFNVAGRRVAAVLAFHVLSIHLRDWSPDVPTAIESAGTVYCQALEDEDSSVRHRALALMGEIWSWDGTDNVTRPLVEDWKRRCYILAAEHLADSNAEVRAAAALAIVDAPFHEADIPLIELLDDDDPVVKKAALKALSHAADGFSSEQKSKLVTFLHDSDPGVSHAAAALLRASGLSDAELRLAWLLKHPVPAERAKVASLAGAVVGDPALWLLELGNDCSPSVRLAMARAAAASRDPRLQARARQMALSDADENVRAMTQQWLQLERVKADDAP
jgi:HEAT repeat protein